MSILNRETHVNESRRPMSRDWHRWLSTTLLVFLAMSAQGKPKWEQVSPADLAATDSIITPGADAEILFSRHVLNSSALESYFEHHVQAKIYTRQGIDRLGMFAVEYEKGRKPNLLMARVVKPDGSSVELSGNDFRDTTIFKYGRDEWIRVTFAFPNTAPGDVIEYRWSDPIYDGYYYYCIYCDAVGIPTREYTLDRLRPGADLHLAWFNTDKEAVTERDRKLVLRNLPAFVEEPLMPPQSAVRKWILLIFTPSLNRDFTDEEIWQRVGAHQAAIFDLHKEDSAITRVKAGELLKGASSSEDRIRRLYEFVQRDIRNLDTDLSAETADARHARKKREDVQSPGTTLQRRSGNGKDINRLFAALASAAGFKVRGAMNADREVIADPRLAGGWELLQRESIGIQLGERWSFYTPGEPFVPCGMLSPKDAGAVTFLCDLRKSWWEIAPTTPARATETRRTGRFSLRADGTLEGRVEIAVTGHRALQQRTRFLEQSAEQRLTALRDAVGARLVTAEISNAAWENLSDATKPLIVRYEVVVPGYADAIGHGLAVPVNYFTAHSPPVLASETRKYPIQLDYAETETDDLELALPSTLTIHGANAPANVGRTGELIHADYDITYDPRSNTLSYRRNYTVDSAATLDVRGYPAVRAVLTAIHRGDSHQIILKSTPLKPAGDSQPSPAPQPTVTTS